MDAKVQSSRQILEQENRHFPFKSALFFKRLHHSNKTPVKAVVCASP